MEIEELLGSLRDRSKRHSTVHGVNQLTPSSATTTTTPSHSLVTSVRHAVGIGLGEVLFETFLSVEVAVGEIRERRPRLFPSYLQLAEVVQLLTITTPETSTTSTLLI